MLLGDNLLLFVALRLCITGFFLVATVGLM